MFNVLHFNHISSIDEYECKSKYLVILACRLWYPAYNLSFMLASSEVIVGQ